MELPKSQQELLQNLEKLIEQTYEAEKEFIELKNILNGVIEFLPQALWVVDKSGEVIVKNSKADEFDFIPQKGEIEVNDKVFLVQTSNIKDKTIISATDITEQKRNERLIAMGQMAAHLAHEIRNPIGSISILLALLKKSCPQNEMIDEMKSAIFRIERIIKSTLLFSKGIRLNKRKFLLSSLKKELEENIKYYSHSKEINFVYFLPDIEIKADYDLLLLVLQNMIINAIDAIEDDEKEEGLIEVLYEKNDKYHIINIYDSGKDFEDTNILFEPFKSTKTKGNGLGLALSKEIITAHEGKIELSKEKKGFKIYLPI
ncbi:sensor histidine kinase [Caminibacter pacificus]|uniref:histidine kinase n=1 Tax=Caminibacter pacificus TaxID=1424653 RepID=A0AAJ4RCF9_9BACT|nr:ATP-binding protein [Caminibacter pacificus]NPA87651.1 GHKL domain-containing protein [Campylobacterota bacterium]QCI27795.1 GHKL domain-containing protein [Caminibacter pacificus]ROR40030.1 two-component system NtrC family sensor kinase/two-component system sensor histidine kinase AtoS [Caminibacter pacificus]